MSAETPADSRLEKRRRRAEQDVRLAHGALLQLVNRHRGEGWAAPLADGWSPAEILFHVLLVLEEALAELRLASAAGLPTHPPVPAARQLLEKKLVFLTWRLPRDLWPHPSTQPGGLILAPDEMARRSTAWAGGFIRFLRENTPAYLAELRHAHSRLGPLSPFEWSRFTRIYIRFHDLRMQES